MFLFLQHKSVQDGTGHKCRRMQPVHSLSMWRGTRMPCTLIRTQPCGASEP